MNYLVIVETREGKLRQVSLEAVQAAALIAGTEESISICAAVIGSGIQAAAQELSAYVSGSVYAIDQVELDAYNAEAYAHALQGLIAEIQPKFIVLGHTAIGRDLAPLLAASLDAGQLSDVISIQRQGDEVLFTRPLYAGKAFEQKRFVGSGPHVVTIRPNNIAAASEADVSGGVIAYNPPAAQLRTIVQEVVRKASGKVDLAEAKVVVSGGRGVKSAEGFKPLEELADVLGGAVGASRGACDAGYCDYALQIGQTGKVVTPELYIACGISGAIQHLAGMSQSRVIIAINKDPEAPIFKVADYGIVGDLFEVVPLLTQELKAASKG